MLPHCNRFGIPSNHRVVSDFCLGSTSRFLAALAARRNDRRNDAWWAGVVS